MRGDTLSKKEEAFCVAYADHGNATMAYKQAGYNYKTENSAASASCQMLAKVKIRNRLQQIAQEKQSEKIMGAVEMQERLTEIARDKTVKAIERSKAMELLAKMQGALAPREQSTDITINVNITDL